MEAVSRRTKRENANPPPRKNGRAGVKGCTDTVIAVRIIRIIITIIHAQSFLKSLCAHFQSRTSVVTKLAFQVPSPTYLALVAEIPDPACAWDSMRMFKS